MRFGDIDPSKPVKLPWELKHVKPTGFCPVQGLVELMNYIFNNVASLRCFALYNGIHGFEKVLVAHIAQDTGTVTIKSGERILVTRKDSYTT